MPLYTFVEKENSRPITNKHVTLPGLQNTVNYKVPCIAVRFCYHHSENQQKFAKCHVKTDHTSERVNDDTSSPARVSDDTSDLARVSDDISKPIRL